MFLNIVKVMVNPIELRPKIKFLSEGVAVKYEREWYCMIVTGALWLRNQC